MRNWIPCQPLDRASMGMMRFILQTCQNIKVYTAERVMNGDRRGSTKPQEVLLKEWRDEYLRNRVAAWDVPRYAFQDAMEEVFRNGVKTMPQERRDYRVFSVEARVGWKKEPEQKEEMNWQDYLEGKERKRPDGRLVTPERAVQKLFDEGIITFRWGGVELRGDFGEKLRKQAEEKGIGPESILRRTKSIDFAKRGKDEEWNDWTLNFNLE